MRTVADAGAEGVALTDGTAGFENSLPEPLPLENMRAQELSYACRRCRLPRTVAPGRTQPTRVSTSEQASPTQPHTYTSAHTKRSQLLAGTAGGGSGVGRG